MNLFAKEPDSYREQPCDCQGRDELGVLDLQMQTTIHRMDKRLTPTVQHRELYRYPVITIMGKNTK